MPFAAVANCLTTDFPRSFPMGFIFFQIPPGNQLSTLRCRYAKITLGSYFLASALQGTLAQISIPFIYDQGQHTQGHIWKDVKTEYILHRRDKKSQYGLKYSEWTGHGLPGTESRTQLYWEG